MFFSIAFFLIKALSCIGFFVIIIIPPCNEGFWTLREAALRNTIVYLCLYLWISRTSSLPLPQSECHCRYLAKYHIVFFQGHKQGLDCHKGISILLYLKNSFPAQHAWQLCFPFSMMVCCNLWEKSWSNVQVCGRNNLEDTVMFHNFDYCTLYYSKIMCAHQQGYIFSSHT